MTSSIQQLREMIPLYLNGSLSEQQASEFRLQIKKYPELELELDEFEAIDNTFDPINMPDEQQFDSLFKQIETKISQNAQKQEQVVQKSYIEPQQSWLDNFKDLFSNPFVGWGVALAQFALIAVIVFQTPTQENELRYQSLSADTPQATASINVVFTETATLAQLNALMLEHQLEIIAGPGRGKAYQLSINQGSQPDDVVQQLRQSSVVRFAEKTGVE